MRKKRRCCKCPHTRTKYERMLDERDPNNEFWFESVSCRDCGQWLIDVRVKQSAAA